MRIIVGVSGASGVEMSYYLLKALKSIENCEVHLILSQGAKTTWKLESDIPVEELLKLVNMTDRTMNHVTEEQLTEELDFTYANQQIDKFRLSSLQKLKEMIDA